MWCSALQGAPMYKQCDKVPSGPLPVGKQCDIVPFQWKNCHVVPSRECGPPRCSYVQKHDEGPSAGMGYRKGLKTSGKLKFLFILFFSQDPFFCWQNRSTLWSALFFIVITYLQQILTHRREMVIGIFLNVKSNAKCIFSFLFYNNGLTKRHTWVTLLKQEILILISKENQTFGHNLTLLVLLWFISHVST